MSFDNIQLSPLLLKELYKDVLVDLTEDSNSSSSVPTDKISFLGRNSKNILLLVNVPDVPFLEDKDLDFLTGILSACKLSVADIALVNLKDKVIGIEELNKSFSPEKIILFGTGSSEINLPLQFPDYQIQQYNGQTFLSSPSLKELASDKDLKRQLWESLQKLFL
jgi:hypothetical protein